MKNHKTPIRLLLIALIFSSNTQCQKEEGTNDCLPSSLSAIKEHFRFDASRKSPLIMAHRGGAAKGFPENCIPTFERTLENVDCPLIEFDVRMTRDRHLVLLHDDELELCTNGQGLLSEA